MQAPVDTKLSCAQRIAGFHAANTKPILMPVMFLASLANLIAQSALLNTQHLAPNDNVTDTEVEQLVGYANAGIFLFFTSAVLTFDFIADYQYFRKLAPESELPKAYQAPKIAAGGSFIAWLLFNTATVYNAAKTYILPTSLEWLTPALFVGGSMTLFSQQLWFIKAMQESKVRMVGPVLFILMTVNMLVQTLEEPTTASTEAHGIINSLAIMVMAGFELLMWGQSKCAAAVEKGVSYDNTPVTMIETTNGPAGFYFSGAGGGNYNQVAEQPFKV